MLTWHYNSKNIQEICSFLFSASQNNRMSLSSSFSFLLALVCVCTVVSSQSCSVSERTGCGFIGIDQATCVSSSYNCCWKNDVAPYCYQPALSSPSPSPPPPPPPPSGNSYQLTFTFTGGISFCSQCGANGEYAVRRKLEKKEKKKKFRFSFVLTKSLSVL